MPELPEVETVRRTLAELVIGKTIEQVDVGWAKMIKKPDDVDQFKWLLKGQTIRSMGRRGKFLLFHLDDYTLVSHLRMEGRYGLYQQNESVAKHTHVRFVFGDGTELRYQDVRKFGTMHLFQSGREQMEPPLAKLGVEPFSDQFSAKLLTERLSKTSRKIKSALLDQGIIVGLGNIYVDEALFRARIHPERLAKDVTVAEVKVLHQAILNTLTEAVNLGGSSIKSYVNGQGEMGMFQQRLDVYGRKGEACRQCGTPITKTVVGGRGTHFCSVCQK
ncbi:DNA-formamidopyrimidine glycosylase [Halalkalibacterium halodurans]|jgi:formamidopyrimidine-DNA glycosylase|uniref:DNA-formamidopyrimidine glycosylase n=1 Tax=Halalkalibacterium halodurans TaxID=86665 RepID=UPI0010681A9E|nr:DNA-formamidopyrimidine glycosylase [Halalkalibacterium halodurans]MED3645647.1 DNA-formamidopyrimidine glycosylase [Halalkalibacterium halodurans]MED4164595.1 DNA-formamidopyrimidine glycosylase [Halalkalibacterium halodurans]TES58209.1 DNA-formamidopyrimidine glycosylase [Halalkalibacterium halodurans]